MDAKEIVIVPSTHWDREWYVLFNEFRSYLVIMMDKLIEILKDDPKFRNFTLDGQTVILEDYLEVRPESEEILKKFIKEKRISIGPMYLLVDEFLVSGESLIRNLILGHKIARKFGNIMKAGYIPDSFGHIAQLPQILRGFEIPSILFARGFGNEFEEKNLNMEFIWNAPGNAASVLAIHLIGGYFSASELDTNLKNGQYKKACRKLKKAIKKFERYTATNIVLLINGSDHLFPQPEITDIVRQWNETNPNLFMEINDFEYYINKILELSPHLKEFQGELRAGKYMPILSGVLSTRMWIKQKNTEIEYLYEKYAEPISAITCILDKFNKFKYPNSFLWLGLKYLIKNHPHDSICGCSIDEVHDEMKTRFNWAQQIGNEILKDAFIYLADLIKIDTMGGKRIPLIIYNPLPWKRRDIVHFDIISSANESEENFHDRIKLIDFKGNENEYQETRITELPRYQQLQNSTYRVNFVAEIPACGYKVYYILPKLMPKKFKTDMENFKINQYSLENKFYLVKITEKGIINLFDKINKFWYENICQFEECGDWGDEYDFSGPKGENLDRKFTTKDAKKIQVSTYVDGPSQKTIKISLNFNFPISLSDDRSKRDSKLIENQINLFISLYKDINRVDFRIEIDNKSKDHRIRVLFPSKIKAEKVFADGHFYIIPRNINLPNDSGWIQKISSTNHQKDFISIIDTQRCFAVLNKGLHEYEAIKEFDDTITFAITLLRGVGWLSRADLATRGTNAGPDLQTPKAQCLNKHTFELSLVSKKNEGDHLKSCIHLIGKEFNNPLMLITPQTANTPLRLKNKVVLTPNIIYQIYKNPHVQQIESYLPESFSFLEIDNPNIQLSALKKSEVGDFLIVRCYNLSFSSQKANLKFCKEIIIKNAHVVNLLEEKPKYKLKSEISLREKNIIELILEAHIIATIKIEIQGM